jgi:hypothetical protein
LCFRFVDRGRRHSFIGAVRSLVQYDFSPIVERSPPTEQQQQHRTTDDDHDHDHDDDRGWSTFCRVSFVS